MVDYTGFMQAALAAEGYCRTTELIRPYVKTINAASQKSIDLFLKFSGPYIINMALASELYLKALLLYKTKHVPKTHDLLTLYNCLDKEDKDNIEARYSATTTIPEFLTEQRNVFVDYRYPHEQHNGSAPQFAPFEQLVDALAYACAERQKAHLEND